MGSLGVRLTGIGDRLRVHAPKGKLPTDLRAQVAERKAEILAYLGESSPAKRSIPPPIHPRATQAPAPLSLAQERLWFLEQLEPQSAVYNICRAVCIGGNLNVSALEAALNEIIRRHQTLRTAFRLVDGQAVQIIEPSGNLAIATIDLRSLCAGDRDVEINRSIKADAERPFDLHGGSLLRCKLVRVGDSEHILILVTHHVASDAWSMGILTRELWTLYQLYSQGKSSPLDPLPVQYSDYAVWQRDWLQGEVLEAQLSYWKEQLKELPILNLPTDRSRKPRQGFRGARVGITLSAELTTAINELSHRHGATPFMTLLAAFQVLLYRYSGQEDFALGSPIANRRRPEIESLIGFFVNTLVLRANLSGNPSFAEVLSRVKDTCIGANANQDLPFEKLVQEIQPERDQSRNPLFQVMFVLQNATRPFSGISGLRIEPVEIEATRSPFDLSLFLREREGRYIGFFEYSTDLFNRDRIERMVDHFQTLLGAAVSNPDQPIATLPILTEPERHQILVEWNDTAADYPQDKCIHQLFEEQVERTPDAVAVEFENQQITYAELNRRANQLGHHLIGLGIGPEKLVGICVERSIEMVVGLLGILKAGGAYVPLDPSYPEERLRFMLDDADIAVLLTQESLLDRTHNSTLSSQLLALCLDRDWALIAHQHDDNPNQAISSNNLAYVIYTSGSTGKPKGVAIEHRNTSNLLHWAKTVYTADELRSVLASTSICFDLSVFELFVTLSSGGKVFLVENALCLRDHSPDCDVTLINTVPSVMSAILAAGPLPETIHTVNLAGEPLRRELVKQLYDLGTLQKVYDLYGPSETTTYSTFALRAIDGPITIGRPVANTRIYILDSHLEPVPIGAQGEIYIGGAGVARGYLNRAELTSDRFVENPFAGDGSLLYRTGDLARYLPNGNIEFLGRTDNQVKIRGYRIELGEIESTLIQHPAVKETVIVPFDEPASDSGNPKSQTCAEQSRSIENPKSLLAYVVPQDRSQPTISELRQFLQDKLPDYMVPSLFFLLDALPLTSNGKLDRSALPPPDGERPALDQGSVQPRTQLEQLVAQTWRKVLKIETIGIHDSFFELGGHSLLALQIVARLKDIINKEVPLRVLFDTPSIAELADELQVILREGDAPGLPPISPVQRGRPVPLSMNQEHLWKLRSLIQSGTTSGVIPHAVRLSGVIHVDILETALQELVRRHEAIRTVFAEVDGSPAQVIKDGADIRLESIDLIDQPDVRVSDNAALGILESLDQSFDLAVGPLFRTTLIRLNATESILLVLLHHIVGDEWSIQILLRELFELYGAILQGHSLPVPLARVQFADYAIWERRLLAAGVFRKHSMYWVKQLAPQAGPSRQQSVSSNNTPLSFKLRRAPIEIDRTFLDILKRLAATETVTVFIVLLGALYLLLHSYTQQSDISIATLVANRGRKETEMTVGYFLNTVVLRAQIRPNSTVQTFLREIKSATLSAYAHQDVPFEQILRDLELENNNFDRTRLCPVLLNYHLRGSEIPKVSGLDIAEFDLRRNLLQTELIPTAFDLILDLHESPTQLTGFINYKLEVFTERAVSQMTRSFVQLLRRMASAPGETLSALCMGSNL